jgi:hypothetical protein
MSYVQITPQYGDLNRLPAVQYKGHLEELQGVIRLIDAMLAELYGSVGSGGGSVPATGSLVTDTPGSGSHTGYAPAIGVTTGRLDIVADAAGTTLNDMTAGFDGQRIRIRNTGSGVLALTNQNAGSTAANRFSGSSDAGLYPGDKLDVIYYGGSVNRWIM